MASPDFSTGQSVLAKLGLISKVDREKITVMPGAGPALGTFAPMVLNARTPFIATSVALLALAGCGRESVNPPTEPATPVTSPDQASAVGPTGQAAGVGPAMPSAGPASFVGAWAARPAWCANRAGPEQPIRITTTRFEGYENTCAISAIDQVNSGYEATMTCRGEGQTSRERVRMAVLANDMTLTWLSRNGAASRMVRCGAPAQKPVPPLRPLGTPPGPPPIVIPSSENEPAFVGVWSQVAEMCRNTTGNRQPIRVTRTRFVGSANQCDISNLRRVGDGWNATFLCTATDEPLPVRMEVKGDRFELTWIGQAPRPVVWRRCPVS